MGEGKSVKRKRARPVTAGEPVAKEVVEEKSGENLTKKYSQLFGGSGGSSGLSSFLAGAATSGPATSSSSSAAPVRASPAPTPAPSQPPAAAAVRSKASSSAAGAAAAVRSKGKHSSRGVPVDLSTPDTAEEPPEKRRRTEGELHERQARTLFVGNIPLDWEKPQLRRALRAAVGDKYSGQFRPIWFRAEPLEEKWQGNLRKVGSIKKDHAKGKGDAKNAYVVLTDPEDVTSVRHAVHGYVADEKHVLRADGVGESAQLQTFDRKRSVFVGNLPASCSDADLRNIFKPAGVVDAVRVVCDRHTKACKGFAFIRFKERTSVKTALNLWGVELQGRPVRVMKVTQQDDASAAGGYAKVEAHHPAQRRIGQGNAAPWDRGAAWGNSAPKSHADKMDFSRKKEKGKKPKRHQH